MIDQKQQPAVSRRQASQSTSVMAEGKISKLFPLFLLVLVSAFAIVYFKDLNRRLFIQYQSLRAAQQQTRVTWGKLLLEQSAWSTQARIQNIAQSKLGMVVPATKDIVMVQLHTKQPSMASQKTPLFAYQSARINGSQLVN